MSITTKKATGVLAEMLANTDERELARTRKRMMLACKIEDAMKRKGLNQIQFARLMHKSPTVISEWLSGDRNFTTDTLTDIEDALGVKLLNVSVMVIMSDVDGQKKTKRKGRHSFHTNEEAAELHTNP